MIPSPPRTLFLWAGFAFLLGGFLLTEASAQSAGRHYDVLRTLDGRAFTNAVISSSTPAYLIVIYDGGGQKVWLTNLDEKVRADFGYNASAADGYQRQEAEKKKKVQDAVEKQTQAALQAANAVGEVQKIEVLQSLGDYKYRIKSDDGEETVIFLSMPGSVTGFLAQELALDANRLDAASEASSANTTAKKTRAKKTPLNFEYPAASANAQTTQTQAAAAHTAEDNANKAYHDLEAHRAEKATIFAGPTGRVLYGLRVWQFTGFPKTAPAATAKNVKKAQ